MKFGRKNRVRSSKPRAARLAGLSLVLGILALEASPVRGAEFSYPPIADQILSASFSADFAALTAHRTIGGHEVNFAKLLDLTTGLAPLDLSNAMFGATAWPAPAQLSQGALQTGWVSAAIDPSFFSALAGGQIGIYALFTDTNDAKFAIDALALNIETATRTMSVSYYGTPVGNANNGFGAGIPDGGNLSAPLPGGLPDSTGTGFDEVISSKSIPEPASLVLFGLAFLGAIGRRRAMQLPFSACAAAGLVVFFLGAAPALSAPEIVQQADDCWITDAVGADYSFSISPIPADFFNPGSLPFDGTILFAGDPLDTAPPAVLEGCDTIVRRLQDTLPLGIGDSDTVDVEILALSLVGTLTVDFGDHTELWSVRVCLSPNTVSPIGQMTITRDQEDGGYFFASFGVIPRFTFVGPGGSPTRALDCGDPQYVGICDDLVLVNEDNEPNYWVFIGPGHIDPTDIEDVSFGAGIAFDGTCNASFSGITIGSGNTRGGLLAIGGGKAVCAPNKEAERENHGQQKKGSHDRFRNNSKDQCNNATGEPGPDSVPDFCEPWACCLQDGRCVRLKKHECEAQNGQFQGFCSKCEPLGACCMPDGRCIQTIVECCDDAGGYFVGEGTTSCPVPPCIDQVHVNTSAPNTGVATGQTGSITAVLEAQFAPVPNWEIVFTKLTGPGLSTGYTFANGDISPDGAQSSLHTDANGTAVLIFTAGEPGYGLVEVRAADTGLSAFSFFQMTAAQMRGDTDGDGDVDLQDHAYFASCLCGPVEVAGAGCQAAALDPDPDVDLADCAQFQAEFAQ